MVNIYLRVFIPILTLRLLDDDANHNIATINKDLFYGHLKVNLYICING